MAGIFRSRWTIAGFAFALGALLALAITAGTLIAFWGWRHHPQAQKSGDQPVYTRADFAKLVLGKTEAQVFDALGKTDLTSEDDEALYWHYRKRTEDPVTGQPDSDVQLIFQDGRVVNIGY